MRFFKKQFTYCVFMCICAWLALTAKYMNMQLSVSFRSTNSFLLNV